jgi:hypothetical protein
VEGLTQKRKAFTILVIKAGAGVAQETRKLIARSAWFSYAPLCSVDGRCELDKMGRSV